MKYILGKKQNMTQYFTDDGKAIPATVISAGPIIVTQVKTNDNDKYGAIQVGYEPQKVERVSKAVAGHTGDLGAFKRLKEIRTNDLGDAKRGDAMEITQFEKGDSVVVTSTSKSKGFQGVVKRYGFHGGPRSHGQKHSEREPGSIGGGLRTRVPKGMRMAGRTGGATITVSNLVVLDVNKDTNTMIISGAVPGRRGTVVEIKSK